jgi:ArsR family transcriptional regulator
MLRETEKLLKIFSDKNRLRILKLLEVREMCVCELAYVLEVTQPSISRHLRKMKESGLIKDEQDGFWTNYSLLKGSETTKDVMHCIQWLLKDDKTIKADLKRLKKADRTKLCCK